MAHRTQRLIHHLRPEVGPADTDIDHVTNRHALVAEVFAQAQPLSELRHATPRFDHLRHDVELLAGERPGRPAQCGMQYRAPFADVDLLPGEHPLPPLRDQRLLGQRHKQSERLRGHPLLGKIVEHPAERQRKRFNPLWIGGEQITEMGLRDCAPVRVKSRPCGRSSDRHL